MDGYEQTNEEIRQKRLEELDQLGKDELKEAVLTAESDSADISEILGEMNDNYLEERKKNKWFKLFFIPFFLLFGLMIGAMLQASFHWLPEMTLCKKAKLYKENWRISDSVKLERGKIIAAYRDSLANCRENQIDEEKVAENNATDRNKPPRKILTGPRKTGVTDLENIIPPPSFPPSPPPPPEKEINQDSIELFSLPTNQLSPEDQAKPQVAPASGERGYIKPTKYGVSGKKKTYTNYGRTPMPIRREKY
jgi:hypothetical protein